MAEVLGSEIQTACLYIKTAEGLYGRFSGFGLISSIGLLEGLQRRVYKDYCKRELYDNMGALIILVGFSGVRCKNCRSELAPRGFTNAKPLNPKPFS